MAMLAKFLIYAAVVIAVIVVGSFFAYAIGLASGFNVPSLNLLNSVYYTIDTLTTNSYGDIVPISSAAKIFTILTELAGVSIFIGALTIISGEVMESRVAKITGDISGIERLFLRNHVVLIGTNTVNMYLAGQLKAEKKRFVMLTHTKMRLEELRSSGYPIHFANINSREALARYGIANADKVIIDLPDRSLSLYAFLVVRGLAGKKTKIRVIARDDATESYLKEAAGSSGVQVINPEYNVAKQLLGKA